MSAINKQAIKFLAEGETPFNDKVICGCDLQEDWSYIYTDGDTIDFQIDATCGESTNTILNGGFEEGSSSTSITSWTRTVTNTEQTNVQRLLDTSAPCGTYLLKFTNVNTTPNLAKVQQTQTFSTGSSYKIKLRAKIETGGTITNNCLEIIVGGLSYYITPTTTWEEYEIVVNFTSAPTDSLIVIKMNQIVTDVQAIYVDCVEMSLFLDCCIFERINNGCFELGQVFTDASAATVDNWGGVYTVSETLGLNGSRCIIIPGIADYIEQLNVLASGRNFIRFWAKSDVDGVTMEVYTDPSNTVVGFITMGSDWAEYTLDINSTDEHIRFLSTYDEPIYIDCVSIVNVQDLNITIEVGDTIISVAEADATPYGSYINVSIPIDSYEQIDGCFRVCIDSCYVASCSEYMKYTQEVDGCLKELVWYDSEDVALGINYASGFKNKVKVKAQLQNPNYIKEDFVKTSNNGVNFINSSKVRKTQELSIDSIPEFLWDRLSQCLALSNIEYDGATLTPSLDSEIAINYDKNTLLYSGTITLSPSEEYIVNRTYNCS